MHINTAPRTFRRLALAAAIAAAGLAATAAAVAQQAPAVAGATQRFDIPAGTLTAGLNALARQAGLALSFDPSMAQGVSGRGVSGELTTRQAFDQLLAGTDLMVTFTGANSARLYRAQGSDEASGEAVALESMSVVADRASGSGPQEIQFKADRASVTRSGASILDTPQVVNVITNDVVEQQNVQTVGDVVRNTAGATPSSYFGTYESVYIRGFWLPTISTLCTKSDFC